MLRCLLPNCRWTVNHVGRWQLAMELVLAHLLCEIQRWAGSMCASWSGGVLFLGRILFRGFFEHFAKVTAQTLAISICLLYSVFPFFLSRITQCEVRQNISNCAKPLYRTFSMSKALHCRRFQSFNRHCSTCSKLKIQQQPEHSDQKSHYSVLVRVCYFKHWASYRVLWKKCSKR